MHTFRSYLEKRYQYPIANQIATIMAPRFQNGFQNTVLIADYYKTIEKFANQGKEENLRFIFKLFDVFNEDKITEAGLFKFMEDASLRRHDQPAIPSEVLRLNEVENDIFLDIFTNTYAKIAEAITKKSKKGNVIEGQRAAVRRISLL